MTLDLRLLRVTIEFERISYVYTDLDIEVQGIKFMSAEQGNATITLTNLNQINRDAILTEGSPFNPSRTDPDPDRFQPRIRIEAGRESTGLSLLYIGEIYRAKLTQKPDQKVIIRSLTSRRRTGEITQFSAAPQTPLSEIALRSGALMGLPVNFETAERLIRNFNHSGPLSLLPLALNLLGDINVFVDNGVLNLKDKDKPLRNQVRVLPANELVGLPEITEQGIKVTYLYDARTVLGGRLDVTSNENPAASGRYQIYKLQYHLTNRDTPFIILLTVLD